MPAGTVNIYPNAIKSIVNQGIDLLNDTMKIILLDENHAYNSSHTELDDVSANEIATAYGYTQQTKEIAGVTVTLDSGVTVVDLYDPTWVADGGSISASAAVIYDVTAGNLLVASIAFAEEAESTNGKQFVVEVSDYGLMTFT